MQLYETIQIRHGNMLIGPACGGKTSVLKCLAKALSNMDEDSINLHILNPKATDT
jgi:dynein heavy chain, axonemal